MSLNNKYSLSYSTFVYKESMTFAVGAKVHKLISLYSLLCALEVIFAVALLYKMFITALGSTRKQNIPF